MRYAPAMSIVAYETQDALCHVCGIHCGILFIR